MKRLIMMLLLVALAIPATGVGVAAAAVNAVTPSTNDINKDSGYAYVNVTPGPGTASLAFTTPNAWYSCFEYRTDGNTSQKTSPTNPNTDIEDVRYPSKCVNGTTPSAGVTVNADEYVEVRMVFGAEGDERFDWTRFDVLPVPCTFTTSNSTMTLDADCGTDTTIKVPNGVTLDGNGHKITAVDPSGAAFVGAVVENDGGTMHVKNLKVGVDSDAINNCGAVNGVAFMAASGSIKGVTLTDISRNVLDGCNNGRAILVDNIAGTTRQSVKIEGNTVSDYNKNGIDVRGNVDAKIIGNTVTGTSSGLVARNGIVVRSNVYPAVGTVDTDTATAQVWDNTISGNVYTPGDVDACGILVMGKATVNMTKKNTLSGNDKDVLVEGGSIVGKKASA